MFSLPDETKSPSEEVFESGCGDLEVKFLEVIYMDFLYANVGYSVLTIHKNSGMIWDYINLYDI